MLMHISSLPGEHGIGDLGPAAFAFADWCAAAGVTIWQTLPVGPVGPGDSPYASTSSFAGEPLFVSLDVLREEGLLTRADCAPGGLPARSNETVRYAAVRAFKTPRLMRAYDNWRARGGERRAGYRAFVARESYWLPGWCRFACAGRGACKHPGFHAFVQWQFDRQWSALHKHCAAKGVLMLGDLPIFVPLKSADVQDNPRLFRLDSNGQPTVRTGVPPDCFSRTGQLWGHPHYRWAEHTRTKFAWWSSRALHALKRCDALRIDHFVGLVHAYEIPGKDRTARRGEWRPTPGLELLTALERAYGRLPLVAEDLGALTPRVTALRQRFGLPGMKLVHNAFYGPASSDLPCMHPVDCVAYAGTHDNNTTLGWWNGLKTAERARFAEYAGIAVHAGKRGRASAVFGASTASTASATSAASTASATAKSVPAAMMRIVLQSPARTAVLAMQDVLGLDQRARMNTPGRGTGQWRWRMPANALRPSDAASIRGLAEASARA